MGTTHKLESNSCFVSTKHPCKYTINHLPGLISMAITGEGSKVLRGDSFAAESLQNLRKANRYGSRPLACDPLKALRNKTDVPPGPRLHQHFIKASCGECLQNNPGSESIIPMLNPR